MSKSNESEFEKAAQNNTSTPIWLEFLYFLKHNKKWWLLPILLILLILGLILILSTTAAAPFIYTLF